MKGWNGMDIKAIENGKILTVMPVGRMDSTTSDDFLTYVEQRFTTDFEMLSLDFSGVDYISSKGLRVLLLIYKSLSGRKMEITGANESVKEVLRITGFAAAFGVR